MVMLTVSMLKRLHLCVSLELKDGECIALQGPSGVGKNLLLRAIADLDAQHPERLAIVGAVGDEVMGPDMVGTLRP